MNEESLDKKNIIKSREKVILSTYISSIYILYVFINRELFIEKIDFTCVLTTK